MTIRRHPQAVVAVIFALAMVVSLGPHLLMLGYNLAGVRPPAGLLFICPLHHLDVAHARELVLKAKPLA